MADAKISALAAITSLGDTDEMVVASGGATKKITGANLNKVATDHIADASAAHAASAISVDSTTLEGTGTDVQAVFEELDNAKSNKLLVENVQTDSYTLVLGDADLVVVGNKGTAMNITVPLNATVAYSVGTVIALHQRGAGQVTVVATGGVTIDATPGLKLRAQYSSAALRKYGTDTWVLAGDIAA